MTRGSGGVAEAPRVAEPADDRRLVAAVRRGDDRPFEALYERYHRRIHAYVLGMVRDHGRAEDVTQEVFMSALRRMRDTERPIAFKPWIYEIAKNACIDQFRRSRRAEELSLEAGDGLGPADHGRLVGSDPAPPDALAAKQELDHLCGAFGGLSETHYEVLVMRELEGLSYREIGERLGMSRPAVESTLFRARRRLSEEYGELASGARCERIQDLIATAAADTRLGMRDSRRLRRHLSHCQPCRREAMAAGLDAALLAPVPLRRRVAEKLAGLLPFGWLGRGRGGGTGASMLSEQLSGSAGKVATAAAVLIAGAGAAGVGTQAVRGGKPPARAERPAAHESAAAPASAKRSAAPARRASANASTKSGTAAKRTTAPRRSRKDGGAATTTTAGAPAGTTGSGSGAGGSAPAPAGGGDATAPVTQTAQNGTRAAEPVEKTVENAGNTVQNAGNAVQPTVNQATNTVQGAAQQVTDGADRAVGGAGQVVGGAGQAVGGAGQAVGGAGQAVDDAGQTVEDTTGVPVPGLP